MDLPFALALWRIGALALWRFGALAHWRIGALAQWRIGAMALWRFASKMTITSTTVKSNYIHQHVKKLDLSMHLLISQHQVIGLTV